MTRLALRWTALMLAVPLVYALLVYVLFALCVSIPFLIVNGG